MTQGRNPSPAVSQLGKLGQGPQPSMSFRPFICNKGDSEYPHGKVVSEDSMK